MTGTDKLILALDMDRGEDALALVRLLKPHLRLFKIGNQLFTREGPAIVKAVRAEGVDISSTRNGTTSRRPSRTR